ncbi:hypothetical protein SKAU_G00353310 [Synaphobranchus kaupii]|uniref:Uncharacterized protein n=1 Tax=Synaphobranchus kaupii TaxID=118154 RepID=A0A9Q1EL07_SYNKA|nr:hypothetical protein SKAU_G00353310 [Synaphobranchus kaupii]
MRADKEEAGYAPRSDGWDRCTESRCPGLRGAASTLGRPPPPGPLSPARGPGTDLEQGKPEITLLFPLSKQSRKTAHSERCDTMSGLE